MFVAVVPPQEVLDELERFVEPRASVESDWRWTLPEQWHITVAFLPAVSETSYDRLVAGLEATARRREPFPLELRGAGTFPNPARATSLWAGIHGEVDALSALSVGSRNAANQAGTEVDGAQFRPHVTLARSRRPQEATRWLRVFEEYAGAPWQVTQIELIESHLGQGPQRRPRYETVEQLELGRRA